MTCQRCGDPLSGRQRMWCSENCRKRACDDRNRAACVDCGEPMGVRSAFAHNDRPNERCRGCEDAMRAAGHEATLMRVVDMYRRGMRMREIASALGWSEGSKPSKMIDEARKRGLIGYRHRGYGNAA
jgi:hypothetical protein